jgi:hypothetical protein
MRVQADTVPPDVVERPTAKFQRGGR